jgi:hypothetical protein
VVQHLVNHRIQTPDRESVINLFNAVCFKSWLSGVRLARASTDGDLSAGDSLCGTYETISLPLGDLIFMPTP